MVTWKSSGKNHVGVKKKCLNPRMVGVPCTRKTSKNCCMKTSISNVTECMIYSRLSSSLFGFIYIRFSLDRFLRSQKLFSKFNKKFMITKKLDIKVKKNIVSYRSFILIHI